MGPNLWLNILKFKWLIGSGRVAEQPPRSTCENTKTTETAWHRNQLFYFPLGSKMSRLKP